MMNQKYSDMFFVFHSTKDNFSLIQNVIRNYGFKNCITISDEKIKSYVLRSSIFAVSKSGTISLEICNAKIPSIIIYKIGFINYLIVKMLVKVKFANIINIAANEEIIPELLQSKCNAKNIFITVNKFLTNPELSLKQINRFDKIIKDFKTNKPSELASSILANSF